MNFIHNIKSCHSEAENITDDSFDIQRFNRHELSIIQLCSFIRSFISYIPSFIRSFIRSYHTPFLPYVSEIMLLFLGGNFNHWCICIYITYIYIYICRGIASIRIETVYIYYSIYYSTSFTRYIYIEQEHGHSFHHRHHYPSCPVQRWDPVHPTSMKRP